MEVEKNPANVKHNNIDVWEKKIQRKNNVNHEGSW